MLHVGSDQSPQQQQIVEAASPISSRPPATAAAGSLDELMRLSAEEDAALAAAGEEADRGGGSGGAGGISGNRWPRQETLALLKIRSDMDAVFRDTTIKGPLWEEVSRKLAELGYNRSGKKCKEKFENVHKYYKRTKEGRAGRQDGKSYKFFTQLEALHGSSSTNLSASPSMATAGAATAHVPATLDVSPVSVGIPGPMPISSVRNINPPPQPFSLSNLPASSSAALNIHVFQPATVSGSAPPPPGAAAVPAHFGVSFSSNSSSSSPGSDDDDDGDEDDRFFAGEPSVGAAATSRKRKRSSQSSKRGSGDDDRMMEFFEGLMKQVMQKQEAMQQSFLEAIEKREQDRMVREEAWKRQEMARLAREQELMAQERAISAARDAAIISFLQKITGQTIELPPQVPVPSAPPPQSAPSTLATTHIPVQAKPANPLASLLQQPHHMRQTEKTVTETVADKGQHSIASQALVTIPEQQRPVPHEQEDQIGASGSSELPSSRWPKAEVLALISIRGGLESRYQEAGPKGPLWEEISAGMQRMGYQRSAKRCKEKWENINKYFKKVKESNKKRPEDAKTCPYFHQLDALYRQKTLGGSSTAGGGTSGGTSSISFTKQQQPETVPAPTIQLQVDRTDVAAPESENKNEGSNAGAGELQARSEGFTGNLFGEDREAGATKKPEDIVNELMEQQQRPLTVDEYEKMEETDSDQNVEEEEGDEETEDEGKMSYKIEFQPQNSGAPNGHGFHSQRLSGVHHFIS